MLTVCCFFFKKLMYKNYQYLFQLEDDGKLGRLLSSAPPESAPKLVAIEKDERFVNMAIVCDGTHILLETVDSIEAIAVLIGLYYLADLDYPKAYSQVG